MIYSRDINSALVFAAIFVILVLTQGESLAEGITSNATTMTQASLSSSISRILTTLRDKKLVHSGKNVRHVIVSLENSRHVWPYQRGTTQADILYEIVAEGHITRILSLFRNIKEVNAEIGPVRSVRNYFMPFITDIEALLLFCGASPSGYGRLQKETSIIGCDEISNSDIFHRRNEIARPHNLFTDAQQIKTALAVRQINLTPPSEAVTDSDEMWPAPQDLTASSKTSAFTPAQMQMKIDSEKAGKTSENASSTAKNENISIRYTTTYCVTYRYDKKTGLYYRYINGKPHIDNNCGSQLAPSTVVLAVADANIMDKMGRLDIDIPSELPVTIYSKGRIIKGAWSQPGGDSPLPLCDENDFPFIPPQGQIIFHLITPMVTVNMVTIEQIAKKETPPERFKRLWKGLLSGASVRISTLGALSKIDAKFTVEESVEIENYLKNFQDDLKVRILLVSGLLDKRDSVKKFVATILTTFYKADGYEYVKCHVLEKKLLSNDQYVRSRALTELVDNLEVSGIN